MDELKFKIEKQIEILKSQEEFHVAANPTSNLKLFEEVLAYIDMVRVKTIQDFQQKTKELNHELFKKYEKALIEEIVNDICPSMKR